MENTATSTKRRKASTPQVDVYDAVTSKIMAALEAGTVPWHRPWDPSVGVPIKLSDGTPYRGINVLLLGLEAQLKGYTSPYWGTYRKITELGGQVRKGEKSTLVTLWRPIKTEKLNPATGQSEAHSFLLLRHFSVFNADQADAAEGKTFRLPTAAERPTFAPIGEAERIFAGYFERDGSPALVTGIDGAAWYSPSRDVVSLPSRDAFESGEAFYSTAFHEATHSTGHKDRLAREGVLEGHPFGSGMYAKEELVAEMGAALLCGHAGIETQVEASAAYIASWLKALANDHKLVIGAAGKAQKAVDHVLGLSPAAVAEEVAA